MKKVRQLASEPFIKGVRESTDLQITGREGGRLDHLRVLMRGQDLDQFQMISDTYVSYDGDLDQERFLNHKKLFRADLDKQAD